MADLVAVVDRDLRLAAEEFVQNYVDDLKRGGRSAKNRFVSASQVHRIAKVAASGGPGALLALAKKQEGKATQKYKEFWKLLIDILKEDHSALKAASAACKKNGLEWRLAVVRLLELIAVEIAFRKKDVA
ncbi:MAG: hypothetical protein ABFD84_16945 [Candidatus Polarisedimenticolia bacterium]|nr:hypothetical protein [bacterium]